MGSCPKGGLWGLGVEGREAFPHLIEVLGCGLCGGSSCTGRAGLAAGTHHLEWLHPLRA